MPRWQRVTEAVYNGPVLNDPNQFVSSLADGFTADILNAGLQMGAIGVYQVFLELNTGSAGELDRPAHDLLRTSTPATR